MSSAWRLVCVFEKAPLSENRAAAYYDPQSGTYFDNPTGSDTPPACALPPAPGSLPGTANCGGAVGDVTPVGSYSASPSPIGTFDQGGNVIEWNEAITSGDRGLRAGHFLSSPAALAASSSLHDLASLESNLVGFRIAERLPRYGFSLAEASPSLLTQNGFFPSDILSSLEDALQVEVTDLSPFVEVLGPAEVDAFSQPDPSHTLAQLENDELRLFFSVTAASTGAPATDVEAQSQLGQHPADVFVYSVLGNQVNILAANQAELRLRPVASSNEPGTGTTSDELDALDVIGTAGAQSYHSNSRSTGLFGPADILSTPIQTFAAADSIGLASDDDVDALVVFPGENLVLFSLTPDSPSLTAQGTTYSAADVFMSYVGSHTFSVLRSHSDLGLTFDDDVDALAVPEPRTGLGLLAGTTLLLRLAAHQRRRAASPREGR